MKYYRDVEHEINEFFKIWEYREQCELMKCIIEMIKLYDIDEEDDWVRDEVGPEDCKNVRILRSVYLISRVSEMMSSKFMSVQLKHAGLWRRMEKQAKELSTLPQASTE